MYFYFLLYRAKVGDFGDDVYVKPWTRINPYLVGLLLGYIISRKIYLTRKPTFVSNLLRFWLSVIAKKRLVFLIHGDAERDYSFW